MNIFCASNCIVNIKCGGIYISYKKILLSIYKIKNKYLKFIDIDMLCSIILLFHHCLQYMPLIYVKVFDNKLLMK